MPYTITRERLLEDLRTAYADASRHKHGKPCCRRFEAHLGRNLEMLCDELYSRAYRPRPLSCFVTGGQNRREVFKAQFRDRIVHHLYYNYTHELYERTFIHDTYSCIKGRGTHFGISRLEQHIRSESQNYTVPYYVMKMDIRGCHIVGDPSEWAELPHGANYRLRRRLMLSEPAFTTYGVFDMEYRRYFSL